MKHHATFEGKIMRNALLMLALAGLFALAAVPAAAQSADPVAVLKSDAPYADKLEACRVLSIKGGPDAVAALAPMLTDEKLSHTARMALESMPCAEAVQALRDGLGKTSGALKVGIIGSLAIRKDMDAVPALTALLADADQSVVLAAAAALGGMGATDAVEALQKAAARADITPVTRTACCDGLLDCAAALAAKGQRDRAVAVYDALLADPGNVSQVRAAALRGAALAKGGSDGVAMLVKALGEDDQAAFDAALRALREIEGADTVAAALAKVLPGLAEERKIAVIQVIGDRGGAAAGPALLAEAGAGSTTLRVAALRELTRIAYSPALALAKDLLASEDAGLAEAARNTISYFPGGEADEILTAMLRGSDAKSRALAVEMAGKGGLENPAPVLMEIAQSDGDAGVRLGALRALRNHAGMVQLPFLLNQLTFAQSPEEMAAAESVLAAISGRQQRASSSDVAVQKAVYGSLPDGPMADVTEKVAQMVAKGGISIPANNGPYGDTAPGLVKKLRVDYTVKGIAATQTATEGDTLVLNTASVPAELVDAFCAVFAQAQGDAKLALLRLLGTTASGKAFDVVKTAAFEGGDGPVKDAALRELCKWSTVEALPTIMDLALNAASPDIKVLARRGAVRLLGLPQVPVDDRLRQFAVLMDKAENADDKKLVLSGLAQVKTPASLDMVLRQFGDTSVKAEAVQAAISVGKALGKAAKEDNGLNDGSGIEKWQGSREYWRFDNGVIFGGGDKPVAKNEFLWAPGVVGDFYLAVDVKLEPDTANAGIQFRSQKADDAGQALGYQADIGKGYWGKLYHEHGRGQLDAADSAEAAVKPGDWNRYEILAVGPAIWLAINGTLGAACLDLNGAAERTGGIAVQIHSGPPQTVQYRIAQLVHNPEIKLAGLDAPKLFAALTAIE